MRTFTEADVRLEDWTRGRLFVFDDPAARANKAMLERHFVAEWNNDIEATMRTIHRQAPWQRIPSLGTDVNGFEAVREFYLQRFKSWPGPAMKSFDRATVGPASIYVEGRMEIRPKGQFGGVEAAGVLISSPTVVVIDFLDGLILGETVYVDAGALRRNEHA
jgi:hypothetical protein